jgi:hypothetical protein
MRKQMSTMLTVLVVVGVLCAGCRTRIGDFSVISTGAPQYDSMDEAPMTKTVEGKDARFWFLFIPFGGPPNMKEAVDCCLDNGNGDFIERARLYQMGWSIILFSYGGFYVVGDVGNSKASTTISH